MNRFEALDEGRHGAESHPFWNESFYMNFFDQEQHWAGVSRIGFLPNQDSVEGFVCLFFPDGTVGFIRAWECLMEPETEIRVGALGHGCEVPFEQWHLSYKGPVYCFDDPARMGDFWQTMLVDLPQKQVELNFTFQALHGPFDFHASIKRGLLPARDLLGKLGPAYLLDHLGPGVRKAGLLRSMAGAAHYEQAGRISGTVQLGGQTSRFEGFGQRDHSWGVRDMRVPTNWRWFSCQFGEDFCFNATSVDVLAFRVTGGYVFHQGEIDLLRDWWYEAEMDPGGRWARRITLFLHARSGGRFEVEGKALDNVPVIVNTEGSVCVVNEARARFSCNGRTASGISEFMEQGE